LRLQWYVLAVLNSSHAICSVHLLLHSYNKSHSAEGLAPMVFITCCKCLFRLLTLNRQSGVREHSTYSEVSTLIFCNSRNSTSFCNLQLTPMKLVPWSLQINDGLPREMKFRRQAMIASEVKYDTNSKWMALTIRNHKCTLKNGRLQTSVFEVYWARLINTNFVEYNIWCYTLLDKLGIETWQHYFCKQSTDKWSYTYDLRPSNDVKLTAKWCSEKSGTCMQQTHASVQTGQ
jgi:hypothetical protein